VGVRNRIVGAAHAAGVHAAEQNKYYPVRLGNARVAAEDAVARKVALLILSMAVAWRATVWGQVVGACKTRVSTR